MSEDAEELMVQMSQSLTELGVSKTQIALDFIFRPFSNAFQREVFSLRPNEFMKLNVILFNSSFLVLNAQRALDKLLVNFVKGDFYCIAEIHLKCMHNITFTTGQERL